MARWRERERHVALVVEDEAGPRRRTACRDGAGSVGVAHLRTVAAPDGRERRLAVEPHGVVEHETGRPPDPRPGAEEVRLALARWSVTVLRCASISWLTRRRPSKRFGLAPKMEKPNGRVASASATKRRSTILKCAARNAGPDGIAVVCPLDSAR